MSNTVGWPKQSTAQNIIGPTRAASESGSMLGWPGKYVLARPKRSGRTRATGESCNMSSSVRWFLNVSSCREMSLLSIIMCISRGNESAHVNAREYVATNRTFMRNMKVKMERRAGDSCLPKTMTCKCRRALVQKFQGHESAGLVRDAKKHRPESILGQDDVKVTRRDESRGPTGHHEEQVLRCDRELVGKNKKHHREVARRRIAAEHA